MNEEEKAIVSNVLWLYARLGELHDLSGLFISAEEIEIHGELLDHMTAGHIRTFLPNMGGIVWPKGHEMEAVGNVIGALRTGAPKPPVHRGEHAIPAAAVAGLGAALLKDLTRSNK